MAGPSGSTPVGHYPFPTPDDTVDVPRDVEALAAAIDANAGAIIVGEVRMFGLAAAPARWLACDGVAVEQASYPELYAALGSRFNTGGETPTQFRLPDLRGRAIVGAGTGTGLTARAIAARWGEESHALTVGEMPSHNHGGATGGGATGGGMTGAADRDLSHAHGLGGNMLNSQSGYSLHKTPDTGGVNVVSTNGPTGTVGATAGAGVDHLHSVPSLSVPALSIGSQGGGGVHNNAQPSIALLICIYAGR